MILNQWYVITSYSIHYTKLYDDGNGNPVRSKEEKITFKVEGSASIIGVDNGAIDSVQPYKADNCITNEGHCIIMLKLLDKGEVKITAYVGSINTDYSLNIL